VATARIACTCRRTCCGERLPAGSPTVNEAEPGRRWFCQLVAVPFSLRCSRRRAPSDLLGSPHGRPRSDARLANGRAANEQGGGETWPHPTRTRRPGRTR
jgi:hypothetical protein